VQGLRLHLGVRIEVAEGVQRPSKECWVFEQCCRHQLDKILALQFAAGALDNAC